MPLAQETYCNSLYIFGAVGESVETVPPGGVIYSVLSYLNDYLV